MMKGNQYKATVILVGVSLGFFISYPFQHTFVGGLAAGGFGAAMIGGLADWFAVTALFRRPLGIPFRTAIIPCNRERIFRALIAMVENEILMKDNIKLRLASYNVSGIMIHFMVEHKGKSYLKKILYRFLQDMFAQIKPSEIAAVIDNMIQYNRGKIKIVPYIIDMAEWIIEKGYHERIMNLVLDGLIAIAQNKEVQTVLVGIFIESRDKYERGMNRRKIFNKLMNLSPIQVASAAQDALIGMLVSMKNTDHPIRKQMNAWLIQFMIKLKSNENLQQDIEEWVQTQIFTKRKAGNYITQGMADLYGHEVVDQKQIIRWLVPIVDQIDCLITDFAENEQERARFEGYLKNMVSDWIDIHHTKIGTLVKESLNEFTNERLVNFIEDKVGNDLQMIRINGSVVGGLVGMVIYLLTFWF